MNGSKNNFNRGRMSQESFIQEINLNNILTLNFTYMEERLKKNFEIIARRLTKLEGLFALEDKIKGIEREAKFFSMKLENVILKIPQINMGISADTAREICDQQLHGFMDSPHDDLKNTRFFFEVKDAVFRNIKEEASSLLPSPALTGGRAAKGEKGESRVEQSHFPLSDKIDREHDMKGMTKEEQHYAEKILRENKSIEEMVLEISVKLKIFMRDYEQSRISRGSLDVVNKNIEKFEQYETNDDRQNRNSKTKGKDRPSDKSKERLKRGGESVKQLDGLKTPKEERITLRNERESPRDKSVRLQEAGVDNIRLKINSNSNESDAARHHDSKQLESKQHDSSMSKKKIMMDNLAPNDWRSKEETFKDEARETHKKEFKRLTRREHSRGSLTRGNPVQPNRRTSYEPKEQWGTMREVQRAVDEKVSKEVFINILEELQDKIEASKYARDIMQNAQLKKFCMSMENRMQAVISFVQQLQEDEDPLIAKKKWSCMSCDKNSEKYSAKLGSHLNWDLAGGKKLSPVKAGAFGQTVMFASKLKFMVQGQDAQLE